jgi:Na+/H+ antiporter NhaC
LEGDWTSLIPPLLAILLAFLTRDAVVSLALACVAGVLLMGQGLAGVPALLQRSLGTEDFIWICSIELFIGVLVAFFQRGGAVAMFTARVEGWATNRKRVGILGWLLGLFIFFSDYFSPLFVGPTMRGLTDKHKIPREKLAYICDSTSAPLTAMIPITGWAAYICGLAAQSDWIEDMDQAMGLFMQAIPYNWYCFLSVLMVLALVSGTIPDFGPMKKAERRALETGKVLRDGAVPMMGKELTDLESAGSSSSRTNLFLNFLLPVLIIVVTNTTAFYVTGRPLVLESFMMACTVLAVILWLQKVDNLNGIMQTAYAGMKGVLPAVIILALAYCINTVSKEMGTAHYVVGLAGQGLAPALLPVSIFLISAFISFATGTAWGTYAIMIPIALPLAYEFSGGEVTSMVLGSFAAVIGGGVFGDHCSPLSDTTVLSSLGSASDHMDHVKTQLPYALTVAIVASALYLAVGLMA